MQSIVYNDLSNIIRVYFSHFHKFFMDKDVKIIVVASVIFNRRNMVEMPFIALDKGYITQ